MFFLACLAQTLATGQQVRQRTRSTNLDIFPIAMKFCLILNFICPSLTSFSLYHYFSSKSDVVYINEFIVKVFTPYKADIKYYELVDYGSDVSLFSNEWNHMFKTKLSFSYILTTDSIHYLNNSDMIQHLPLNAKFRKKRRFFSGGSNF